MIVLSLPIALLSACIPTAENAEAVDNPPEFAGACDAGGLDYAVGKILTSDLESKLKSEAKAAKVRVAAHDGMISMDYSSERLNIFIDEARKIIRINCG